MNKEALLREVESFLSDTGMGETYFGRLACKNTRLLERLRDPNSSVTLKTVDRVHAFIKARRKARAPQ